VDVRLFTVVFASIVTNDDGAIGLNQKRRTICQSNAGTTAGLRLYGVARIQLSVTGGSDYFSGGGTNHANIAFEGDEAGTGGILNFGDIAPGVAILPNIQSCASRYSAEQQDGGNQIEKSLLNYPPIKCKTTGSCGHSC